MSHRTYSRPTSLCLLIAFFSLLGCGKGEGGGGGRGTENGTPETLGLEGDWSGFYKPLSDGTLVEPTPDEATANLNADKTFIIELPKLAGSSATGTYEDFKDTIALRIKKSNISKLGVDGDFVQLSYALTGDYLTLSNKRIELKLKRFRVVSAPGPGPGNTNTGADNSLTGGWFCVDTNRNKWSFNFKPDSMRAFVTPPGSDAKTTILLGEIVAAATTTTPAYVRITDSTPKDDSIIGNELAFTLLGAGKLQVQAISRTDGGQAQPRSSFTCKRQ